MSLTLVTGPPQEPVSLEEARQHLRVTGAADDYVIQSLIIAATLWAEDFTHRKFITQVWDWNLDVFPENSLPLLVPFGRLQSVASFGYVDSTGAAASFGGSPSDYIVDAGGEPGRIALAYGVSWPSLRGDPNGVTIRFTAGYGLAAAVPRTIKIAILLLVAHWYENREPVNIGNITTVLPLTVEAILLPYRIYSIV